MQLQSVLRIYAHPSFLTNEQVMKAAGEFFKLIPGRILQVEIDPKLKIRSGYTKDLSLYKFSVNPPLGTASLEYYEHREQGSPTMGIYLNRKLPEIKIAGTKAQKRFTMVYHFVAGEVTCVTKLDQ